MSSPHPSPDRLRVAHLDPRAPTAFSLVPDAERCAALAGELGLDGLSKLSFEGTVRPAGGDAWTLSGRLRARVTQPCVVTLKPVRTSIEETVERRYSPHLAIPSGDEIEMPDETLEPLGQFIDLAAVMIEELALATPEYPRAEGAEAAGPPAAPEAPAPDTRRPFAGLDKLLGKRDRT